MSTFETETVICTSTEDDFIICECGETFSDEDSLRLHLENNHGATQEGQTAEQIIDEEATFFVADSDAVEETVVSTEHVQTVDPEKDFKLDLETQIADALFQVKDEEDTTIVAEEVDIKGEPVEPEEIEFVLTDEGKNVAVFVTNNGVQTCKQVDIRPLLALEHDYDQPKEHMRELFFCSTCGRSYDDEKSVRIHAARMHADTSGLPKIKLMKVGYCDVCNKEYKNVIDPTKCECGGKIVRPAKRSQKKYKPEPRYSCEVCGIMKQSKAMLRYHIRTHTGERPYQCTECPKAFTMNVFLQVRLLSTPSVVGYQL